jgi:hypothetical protein
MTLRRSALNAVALVAALVVAACGGTSPSTAPTIEPGPTDDGSQPTFAMPSLDLGSFAIPSFALPSFNSDAELEAMLPDTIGGQTVVKQSLSGQDFINLGMGGGDALEPLLNELGATVDDLSVAIGSAGQVVVFAYRIQGVPADRIFQGLEAAMEAGGAGGEVSQQTIAGRQVTVVTTPTETTYIYLKDDVVFIVGGALSPEILEDAISQLPS